MAGNLPGLTGDDIRGGMRMAAEDMSGVKDEMARLGRESRLKVLDGEQRKDFFRGMNQDEFDVLHNVAMALGPNGFNALERLMREAADMFREEDGVEA
jgi:hypothetical protein